MNSDLLTLRDLDPPMGDLFSDGSVAAPLAHWSQPGSGECGAPKQRILHSQALRLHGPARLDRLGIQPAGGFHNCGSHTDLDWIEAFRLRTWDGKAWCDTLVRDNLGRPADNEPVWFDLGGVVTDGVLVEIRRCGIDRWWTPWNLADGAFLLMGELIEPCAPRRERILSVACMSLDGLPDGVEAGVEKGAVRFETGRYAVGFWLGRPGFSHLSLKTEDPADRTDLLFQRAASFHQGPQWHEIGRHPLSDPAVRFDFDGSVRVEGNRVLYGLEVDGLRLHLQWTVEPERLRLHVRRESEREVRTWISSVWRTSFRNSVSPVQLAARRESVGQAGIAPLPAVLNCPGHGSFRIASDSPESTLRFEAIRQADRNLIELKLGERPMDGGTWLLPSGRFEAEVTFCPWIQSEILDASAPPMAEKACRRTVQTAFSYRPDMATLSNNGASMPCAICLDTWTALSPHLGEPVPGLPAAELVRYSLERWLDGGPSYASGRIVNEGEVHDAEDEYLMTGTAGLLGLAEFLERDATDDWFADQREKVLAMVERIRARDLDGDGLIESRWRTGVSGTGQWSTCWFDVISFGWKDAFANALLYRALGILARGLKRRGMGAFAEGLVDWAQRLREAYLPTFFNAETGWLAGWRCREGRLHDYAFLPINGAAIRFGLVPDDLAVDLLRRLLAEMDRVDLPDPALGLPGNLWNVPDEDRADILQGYPFGYYQNGGRTHAQARHFVMALYQAGLKAEADRLLERLVIGMARAEVFGGNRSGIDWRYWDDRPCGYEGLLTDQFGILEPVFHRWGRST